MFRSYMTLTFVKLVGLSELISHMINADKNTYSRGWFLR